MSYTLRNTNSSPSLHFAADLYGQARQVGAYRRGTQQSASFRGLDESEEGNSKEPCPEQVRAWLKRQIVATLERYAATGCCTAIELRTLRYLWLDELSLRQCAKADGVTAEAVRVRIEGNKKGQGGVQRKAPEFYRWWAFKQRRRRRGRRDVVRTHCPKAVESAQQTATTT